MTDLRTQQENDARRAQIIADHAAKSRAKGDWHWQAAEALGADGDYVPGQDEGEPPQGAYPNQN